MSVQMAYEALVEGAGPKWEQMGAAEQMRTYQSVVNCLADAGLPVTADVAKAFVIGFSTAHSPTAQHGSRLWASIVVGCVAYAEGWTA